MKAGSRCGAEEARRTDERPLAFGIGSFVRDDGGYTTMAVAVSLLVSLALVFSIASLTWTNAKSGDVQAVADAAAMSGANVVSAYATIAQVLDACVLSMGLLGTTVLGAGLVLSAIPVVQAQAPQVIDAGRQILDARRGFARSAAKGLSRLEGAIPALVAANAASCVSANATGRDRYLGTALALPRESHSDFSTLDDELDGKELERTAEELREATRRKEEADRRADEAKERAWRADCVDDPLCLRSRAESLAGLSGAQNPDYASPEEWRFEYARVRAQNYYLRRWQTEPGAGSNAEELQRSCARREFYRFAWGEILEASCVEEDDEVSLTLPDLPHTTQMVMGTTLYTDRVWPCTVEGGTRVLHCSLSCPGATGPSAGRSPLADVDAGIARRCGACGMDARAMGNVADASTNINNGFEHYWRIVVEASRQYEQARKDALEAERQMRKKAEEGGSAFDRAMELLAAPRPKLSPPGSYGVVAVVGREAQELPGGPTSAVLAGTTLPGGVAISAATLAPDEDTDGHTVLSSVFDGIKREGQPLLLTLVGDMTRLWGKLLVRYGSTYESVSTAMEDVLGRLDGVGLGRVSTWLRDRLSSIVDDIGFEPADMRLRKPVLVNSQQVLDKAGLSKLRTAREFFQKLPTDQEGQVRACVELVRRELGDVEFTVAEIPIPGTSLTVPLKLRLDSLLGAVS
ncbi:hypothetical protein [Olsenella sp. HMSC062G07]|uniref:hypothetical protein n=1 Tax=Olsenella sp. HMSC062G07 TaxID=1739330 RepID=UPI0008A50E8A|nr:hypothetical protein [Olsenella sp. HMSC062G07]OFK23451.1 hypothetical protein HMPREF2826_05070 [Olsenella sp. HMSC062G07]